MLDYRHAPTQTIQTEHIEPRSANLSASAPASAPAAMTASLAAAPTAQQLQNLKLALLQPAAVLAAAAAGPTTYAHAADNHSDRHAPTQTIVSKHNKTSAAELSASAPAVLASVIA